MPPPTLTEDTRVRLNARTIVVAASICLTIIGSAICATWWTSGLLNGIRSDIRTNNDQTTSLASSIEEMKKTTYTLDRASEQALRTAIANPGMRIADPRDPTRLIAVDDKRTP
jgi:hypothetical protein